jgi:hypothetical protein
VANTREEEVAAYSPNQQPRKCGSLGMALDIAISLGTRKLAELSHMWMAGKVDQVHHRQHDAQADAVQHA